MSYIYIYIHTYIHIHIYIYIIMSSNTLLAQVVSSILRDTGCIVTPVTPVAPCPGEPWTWVGPSTMTRAFTGPCSWRRQRSVALGPTGRLAKLSIYLSVCLSVYLSIYLSISLNASIYIYMYIYIYTLYIDAEICYM